MPTYRDYLERQRLIQGPSAGRLTPAQASTAQFNQQFNEAFNRQYLLDQMRMGQHPAAAVPTGPYFGAEVQASPAPPLRFDQATIDRMRMGQHAPPPGTALTPGGDLIPVITPEMAQAQHDQLVPPGSTGGDTSLGDVASGVAGAATSAGDWAYHDSPEAISGAMQAATKVPVVGTVLQATQWGYGKVTANVGENMYKTATTGKIPLTTNPIDYYYYKNSSVEDWSKDPKNKQRIIELYAQGGGRAVYEAWFADEHPAADANILNFTSAMVDQSGYDLATLLPLAGAVGETLHGAAQARALTAATGEADTGARVMQTAGTVAKGPQTVVDAANAVPGALIRKGWSQVPEQFRRGAGTVVAKPADVQAAADIEATHANAAAYVKATGEKPPTSPMGPMPDPQPGPVTPALPSATGAVAEAVVPKPGQTELTTTPVESIAAAQTRGEPSTVPEPVVPEVRPEPVVPQVRVEPPPVEAPPVEPVMPPVAEAPAPLPPRPTREKGAPGWSITPTEGGTRMIDRLAREHPQAFPAIYDELAQEAGPVYESFRRDTEGGVGHPVERAMAEVQFETDVRDAAARQGIEIPEGSWRRPKNREGTSEYHTERWMRTRDVEATKADRAILATRGEAVNPARHPIHPDLVDRVVANEGRGYKGVTLSKEAYRTLPDDANGRAIRAAARDDELPYHYFEQKEIRDLTTEQRRILGETQLHDQQIARQRYQNGVDLHRRLHGIDADIPASVYDPTPRTVLPIKRTKTNGVPDMGPYREIPPDRLRTEPQYQPRNGIDEAQVQNIIDNYNPRRFDPIGVRANADGSFTVLSGHHRQVAMERMIEAHDPRLAVERVPAIIKDGTDAELLEYAHLSNLSGSKQRPSENGRVFLNEIAKGADLDEVSGKTMNWEGQRAIKDQIAVTHLPEDVKALVDQTPTSFLTRGADIGRAIQDGTLSPATAQKFFYDRVIEQKWGAEKVREVLDYMRKSNLPKAEQTGMFGGMDLGAAESAAFDELGKLSDQLKFARAQQSLAERQAKNPYAEAETQAGNLRAAKLAEEDVRSLVDRIPGLKYVVNKKGRGEVVRMGIMPGANARAATEGALATGSRLERGWNAATRPKVPKASLIPEVDASLEGNARWLVERGTLSNEAALGVSETFDVGGKIKPLHEIIDGFKAVGMSDEEALSAAMNIVMAQKLKHLSPADAKRVMTKMQKAGKAWNTAQNITRSNLQFNLVTGGASTIQDTIFDAYTMAWTGHSGAIADMVSPSAHATIARAVQHTDPSILNELRAVDILKDGGTALPHEYLRLHMNRSQTTPHEEMPMEGAINRMVGAKPNLATKILTRPFASKFWQTSRGTLDTTKRIVVYVDQYRTGLAEATGRFEALVRERYANADEIMGGIRAHAEERSYQEGRQSYTGNFSAQDVLDATQDTSLARAWTHEQTGIIKAAKKEVNRVLFSYEKTNLDQQLSKAVFFHYWSSRALALHTDIAMHNPILLATYVRGWKELEREAAANGYPKNFTGMVRFFGDSTGGYFGLFDPASLVVPFTMFSDLGNENVSVWQRAGVFLAPWVEGGLAALGLTSNIPDVTGTGAVRTAIRRTADFMVAEGLDLPWRDGKEPGEDWVRNMEARIYGMANEQLRKHGLPAKAYGPYDPSDSQVAQYRASIHHHAEEQFGPEFDEHGKPLWDQATRDLVLDADLRAGQGQGRMEDNPLSNQAYDEQAKWWFKATLARVVTPGGIATSYGPLNTDRANKAEGDRAAQKTMQQVYGGSPADLTLQAQQTDLSLIGTQNQRNLWDSYNLIVYGNASEIPIGSGLQLGEHWVPSTDLQQMTEEDRKALADAWVAGQDGTADLAAYKKERQAYIDAHPAESGDFQTYKELVRDPDKGGPAGFRARERQHNPNFARALTDEEARVTKHGLSTQGQQNELDQWTTSLAGYEAATGIQANLYDDAPIAVNDPTKNPAWRQEAASGSGSGFAKSAPKTTIEKLTADKAKYDQKMAVVQEIARGMGIDDLSAMNNPYLQPWLDQQFGSLMPGKSDLLDAYFKWLQYNPDGTMAQFAKIVDDLAVQQPAA